MTKERNFGLDLLRSIAITLVILSHCTYLFQGSPNIFLLILRNMGVVGVDLFFVLSGFLIGGLLLKEIDSNRTKFPHLITFWKRRWYRTLPNYFFLLLINTMLLWLFSYSLSWKIGLYFLFLQNFFSAHPIFFSEAWSLSIEEYAYLILPLLMFVAFSIIKKHQKAIFFWSTIFVIFIGLFLKVKYYFDSDIVTHSDWTRGFRKVVIYRLDAIYIGFLLVFLMRKFSNLFKRLKHGLLFFGILLFVGVHFLIYKMQLQPQTDLGFYVFIYLVSISLSCAMAFPSAVEMKHSKILYPLIYFISTRSYAMYIINFSVILLSIRHYASFTSTSLSPPVQWGLCILYLILTIALSNLLYVYFEKPMMNLRDKQFIRKKLNH